MDGRRIVSGGVFRDREARRRGGTQWDAEEEDGGLGGRTKDRIKRQILSLSV